MARRKRTFKLWFYDDEPGAEVPSVAAFLDAYEALCRQHGMRFDTEDHGDHTTISIVPFDGKLGDLDIDDFENIVAIPEAAAVQEQVLAARSAATEAAERKRAAEYAAAAPDDPAKALKAALRSLATHNTEDCERAEAAIKKALKKLKAGA